MTSILNNVSVDKLDDIFNECDNTYHRTIKMKPADVKSSIYFDIYIKHIYFCKRLRSRLV